MKNTIGIIVGSLRKESFSKKLAQVVVGLAPTGYKFLIIPLDGLEIYNQDFDDYDMLPESYIQFRKTIFELDGVIFITPEYNRSIPGVLKNALDVASRPYGKNAWSGKPGAVFSNSPGNLSAFGANHHLRQCLVSLNVPTMQQPEVYLSNAKNLFDPKGDIQDPKIMEFIGTAVNAYIQWFEKNK